MTKTSKYSNAGKGDKPRQEISPTEWADRWDKIYGKKENDMSINKKLDYNTELMVITMEECGELIEACSKAIRCEDYENHPKLIEEAGDVLVMVDLMIKRGLLNQEDLDKRKEIKLKKLKKWSNLI